MTLVEFQNHTICKRSTVSYATPLITVFSSANDINSGKNLACTQHKGELAEITSVLCSASHELGKQMIPPPFKSSLF